MPDTELNINYLIACIDSLNQLKDIPVADELKSMVNDWVDTKITTAVADPDTAFKIYCNWKKHSGDVDAENLIKWIENMPASGSASEFKGVLDKFVSEKLSEGLGNPENKMLFFRSWLSLSADNVDNTFNIVYEQPLVEDETAPGPGDTGALNWPRW
ncbi:MAG: hypothetical protein ACKOB4_12855 [Acidobacteriota bacterium]